MMESTFFKFESGDFVGNMKLFIRLQWSIVGEMLGITIDYNKTK